MKKICSFFSTYILKWYVFDLTAIALIVLGYLAGLQPLLNVESNIVILCYSLLALMFANILSMLHAGMIHRKTSFNIAGWKKPLFIKKAMRKDTVWAVAGLFICLGVGISCTDMFSFSNVFWIVSVYVFTRTFHLLNMYFGSLLYISLFVYKPDGRILDDDIEWEEVSA